MKNFIVVQNLKTEVIERVLMNLANLYSNTKFVEGIQLYREKGHTDSFLILFENEPDFERFNYFVNYIVYPEGFNNQNFTTKGYFKTDQLEKNYEFNIGEWLMVFISKTDKEYDNVQIVNRENLNYLYDFGGRIKKLNTIEEKFVVKHIDLENYNHVIDIYPSKSFEVKEDTPWWKFW